MLDAMSATEQTTPDNQFQSGYWSRKGSAKSLSSTVLQDEAYAFICNQQGLMAGISIIEGTKISLIKR